MFHRGLGKLLIVSDEGQVAAVSLDGKKVQCFSPVPDQITSLDYEAVAYADSTPDLIYIGVENGGEDGVAVIQAAKLVRDETTGELLDVTMAGQDYWEIDFPGGMVGNKGLEGLAFVPDAEDDEGGSFIIGDQTSSEARSGCKLPIVSRQGCGSSSHRCTCSGPVVRPKGWHEVSSVSFVRTAVPSAADPSSGVAAAWALLVGSDHDDELKLYHPRDLSPLPIGDIKHLPHASGVGQEGITV
eukprot:CAMPEP_0118947934 /NCGR_PEP_ID=MMETSP1169-20130426/46924_1 /TAXON_ID=36882 /ORGANISM="Pyramimonas obovata, Strain CCMP722" /LENGTH=241 /DNA_ID=CAMNT_0006894245 /DNA_START=247 /DNA_END=969 /DNA_ORIENTATION=+